METKVNLGCGEDHRSGWYNVDIVDGVGDQTIDLASAEWDLPTDHFSTALMDNVIEHLPDRLTALKELARIVQPSGEVILRFPHWNSPGFWTNPDHQGAITHRTFEHRMVEEYFEPQSVDARRVRFGRLLPTPAALWLADHIGHVVSEVEVVAECTVNGVPGERAGKTD